MSVGMPQTLLLHEFGSQVWAAFGSIPYHVGSSLRKKRGWRDVDVRLILDDDAYRTLRLGDPDYPHNNLRWVSFCLAYSTLGKHMTGLPIDFQIQQQTWANSKYTAATGHPRSAIGLVPLRFKQPKF